MKATFPLLFFLCSLLSGSVSPAGNEIGCPCSIGRAAAAFPFRHRLIADAELFRKRALGEAEPCSERADERPRFDLIHSYPSKRFSDCHCSRQGAALQETLRRTLNPRDAPRCADARALPRSESACADANARRYACASNRRACVRRCAYGCVRGGDEARRVLRAPRRSP